MLPLASCASLRHWPAQPAVVLDAQTEAPIEGAVVVALWNGDIPIWPVQPRMVCYHVESAATDATGRFVLPAYQEAEAQRIEDKWIWWQVYKAGYKYSDRNSGKDYIKEGVYYLERDARQGAERLGYLSNIEQASRCASAGESAKNLIPLYRAIYEEGKLIAATKREREIVDGILSNLEAIELGYEPAMKRAIERAEKRESQP